MTDGTIDAYIDWLNRGGWKEHIFRTGITPTVDFALVWPHHPSLTATPSADTFYFLKTQPDCSLAQSSTSLPTCMPL